MQLLGLNPKRQPASKTNSSRYPRHICKMFWCQDFEIFRGAHSFYSRAKSLYVLHTECSKQKIWPIFGHVIGSCEIALYESDQSSSLGFSFATTYVDCRAFPLFSRYAKYRHNLCKVQKCHFSDARTKSSLFVRFAGCIASIVQPALTPKHFTTVISCKAKFEETKNIHRIIAYVAHSPRAYLSNEHCRMLTLYAMAAVSSCSSWRMKC